MKILTASQIPTDVVDTPLDNLVKLYKLNMEMQLACIKNQGKGLSAVQVGIPWKFFVVNELPRSLQINGDKLGCFINCEYEPVGDQLFESIEGCLSILSFDGLPSRFRLQRYHTIRVKGKRLVEMNLIDFDQVLDITNDSIVVQHEIDHHRGVLISDLGQEIILW